MTRQQIMTGAVELHIFDVLAGDWQARGWRDRRPDLQAIEAMAGLAANYLPSVFSGFRGLPPDPILRAHAAAATRIYGKRSFGAILEFRWRETQDLIVPLLVSVAQRTFGLMLLGVAGWRFFAIREPRRYPSLLWAICLGAGIVGIVNSAADVLWEASRFDADPIVSGGSNALLAAKVSLRR